MSVSLFYTERVLFKCGTCLASCLKICRCYYAAGTTSGTTAATAIGGDTTAGSDIERR